MTMTKKTTRAYAAGVRDAERIRARFATREDLLANRFEWAAEFGDVTSFAERVGFDAGAEDPEAIFATVAEYNRGVTDCALALWDAAHELPGSR